MKSLARYIQGDQLRMETGYILEIYIERVLDLELKLICLIEVHF